MATVTQENALCLIYLKAIANKLGVTHEELSVELNNLKDRMIEQNGTGVLPTSIPTTSEADKEEAKSYPSVEDAPEWKLTFRVNTSEGISTQKVIQKAWTEKQAIFLGRTEQLFHTMNELVKAKQIQAKWNILDSVAEKLV
jgi:hypothetical protein